MSIETATQDAAFAHHVVDLGLRQLGKPYAWAGRGEWAVRVDPADGQSKIVTVRSLGCDSLAFDCAGLVLWAAHMAGGPDLRGWWGADHLWQQLPPAVDGEFSLSFYGAKGHATHVALELGRGLILEAAGGDSSTLTATDAMVRGASVRVGFEHRGDKLGSRSLAGLRSLPVKPPLLHP